MSFRTRWIARWSEVYLKTASSSTPVTAATAVAESHPGTTPTGTSRSRPRTFAAALSQAAICARTPHHSTYPRPRSWSETWASSSSTLSRWICFSMQSAMNSSTLL